MYNKVWVLGSSNVDITYKIKSMPRAGATIQAESCITATGGKGANQAVAAAHWGSDVSMIGAVANDSNGKLLLDTLINKGINTEHVAIVPGSSSGNAVIMVDDQGANCIIVSPGANQYVPLCKDIGFYKGDFLVAQFEVNMDAVEYYFRIAKNTGVITVLNPSPFQEISDELLGLTDIVVANEEEASEIARIQVDGKEAAKLCGKQIVKKGPKTVVITLGKRGAVAITCDKALYFTGHSVKVTDTQGAGDAFLGTLIAKLSQGIRLEDAVSFSNMISAVCVTKKGSTQVSITQINEINLLKPCIFVVI